MGASDASGVRYHSGRYTNLTDHQPKTCVILITDGEELGLNGLICLNQHRWAKTMQMVLNFEAAVVA
jgi:hypothetical protein